MEMRQAERRIWRAIKTSAVDMKAQAGFALLLAGCALLSVSAQSVADFASKEKVC